MSSEKRIKAFVQLGLFLNQFVEKKKSDELVALNKQFYEEFSALILRQKAYNGWFTKENVILALGAISDALRAESLQLWLKSYEIPENSNKNIGVIMAGNIPLVGFHDFLCVLISGNTIQAKLSSNDNTLIRKIGEILSVIEPNFLNKIQFNERLEGFDAVVATGSDNSARYFEQYFGKYPNIIRKNRNSVAILNAMDEEAELKLLGRDIFQYFGLGCRSVSKLYLPQGYKIDVIFEALLEDFQSVTENNKYANNYDYNKAVYLMGNNQLLDNGFILLKEEASLISPVGVLNYEYYESIAALKQLLENQQNVIQCIVSGKNTPINTMAFGEAQCPALSDYADGVDTLKFLLRLN